MRNDHGTQIVATVRPVPGGMAKVVLNNPFRNVVHDTTGGARVIVDVTFEVERGQDNETRIVARWLTFDNFLADMGERPPCTSIDRIDVTGNYEPGNCRWATLSEQRRNQSTMGGRRSLRGES